MSILSDPNYNPFEDTSQSEILRNAEESENIKKALYSDVPPIGGSTPQTTSRGVFSATATTSTLAMM